MARPTRPAPAKPASPARKSSALARGPAKKAAVAPVEVPIPKTAQRAVKPAKAAPAPAPARKTAPAAPATPKTLPPAQLSKDELKVQVEKLERTVARLRAKSRDMTRAAKAAGGRIAELESDVTRLEGVVAQAQAAARRTKQPAKRTTARREAKTSREPDVDAGNTVPEIAAENPPPLNELTESTPNGSEEIPPGHS